MKNHSYENPGGVGSTLVMEQADEKQAWPFGAVVGVPCRDRSGAATAFLFTMGPRPVGG
jgi:hypothetical protein